MGQKFDNEADLARAILMRLDRNIVCGLPLGLGKPVAAVNALYDAVAEQPERRLRIFTALSLDTPHSGSLLGKRFLEPFVRRHFGDNFPRLNYVRDLKSNNVPSNIQISEFYLQSGAWLGNESVQQDYISTNYTHVARAMADIGCNLIMQTVAKDPRRPGKLSLGSNPDVTLELTQRMRDEGNEKFIVVGVVSEDMPYMTGAAEVDEDYFAFVCDTPELKEPLYPVPRQPVNITEYAIGTLAASLVRDGGTLQVGIGALGDALIYGLIRRNENPKQFAEIVHALSPSRMQHAVIAETGGLDAFDKGLYGASEMFIEGFLELYNSGILKRPVSDDLRTQRALNAGQINSHVSPDSLHSLIAAEALSTPLTEVDFAWLNQLGFVDPAWQWRHSGIISNDGAALDTSGPPDAWVDELVGSRAGEPVTGLKLLHAAFFLGSAQFYQRLRDLSDFQREQFAMAPVSQVNQIFGGSEELDGLQRQHARFINTTMRVSLLGEAYSDTLADGRVVSGVGGQYNFVAMAHAIQGGRSIIMCRSTHHGSNGLQSNIVWCDSHATIPRHLRDIVVTEYGIADLRGKTDQECVKSLLAIADSRFQDELVRRAVKAGKLSSNYRIPKAFRDNTPQRLRRMFLPYMDEGLFPAFPFGSDFDDIEHKLLPSMQFLKKRGNTWDKKLEFYLTMLRAERFAKQYPEELNRMRLKGDNLSLQEKIQRRALLAALHITSQQEYANLN